ncbi:uncharacterized protein LOC127259481 [Andrographis paniculata]|uniref:uncharacterized protein LOC127259481 n=1 Tax=Andrographis paniculata TaxID=175694 RepID=UPI0021E8096D|nr:uncharacterized protein LOC127259481 [Andrographis paniculata]XP_051142814.1 uncharacterized protein LOC127259481 [Andrographis paniculata]
MADDNTGSMNLDLNLVPADSIGDGNENVVNLQDWLHNPAPPRRAGAIIAQPRNQRRQRSLWRQVPLPPETLNLALQFLGGNVPPTSIPIPTPTPTPTPTSTPTPTPAGEASVAAEEEEEEVAAAETGLKICEKTAIACVEDDAQGTKRDGGKNNADDGSFFDCNICFDLARDPVLTCCGHLFCWSCIYRWLHHHSETRECPVCKGEVTTRSVTPIYGRGGAAAPPPDQDDDTDSSLNIPERPQARRVESWRETVQRAAASMPMDEIIRRLELSWVQAQARNNNNTAAAAAAGASLPAPVPLSRMLSSRGQRRERMNVIPAIDAGEEEGVIHEVGNARWLSSLLFGRSDLDAPSMEAAGNGRAVLGDAYYDSHPIRAGGGGNDDGDDDEDDDDDGDDDDNGGGESSVGMADVESSRLQPRRRRRRL